MRGREKGKKEEHTGQRAKEQRDSKKEGVCSSVMASNVLHLLYFPLSMREKEKRS